MSDGGIAALAIIVAVSIIVAPILALRHVSRRRDAEVAKLDLRAPLQHLLPVLAQLPQELQSRHAEQVARFLADKRFAGCEGLEVTDDMRLAVAAFACLLTLRAPTSQRLFPELRAVLLYPDAFFVPVTEPDEFGLVPDEPQERVGESWQGDRVVLSWRDVQAALEGDEVNVVVHEFAHQLDDDSVTAEGAPLLADYSRWSQVMAEEFARLRRQRRPRVLDPYGAESPAEFFGVVAEAFIQRGAELARHHAKLYELMRDTFGYDTRDWRWRESPDINSPDI